MKTRPIFLKPEVLFAVFAAAVPLFYCFYANHIWEDFFITFRHSQNLAEGHGLVYQIGERVHGFTSPLGVLLPALFYFMTGKTSYLPAVWLFRIISIAAYASGGLLLLSTVPRSENRINYFKIFLAALFLLDAKSIAFATNGMETGFMIFFVCLFIYLMNKGIEKHWIAGGLCWAGLMWSRPDGFIYILAMSIACLVFAEPSKKNTFPALLKMAGLCAAVYLPWTIGTWAYYGNPLPHTIQAKGGSVFYYLREFPKTVPLRIGSMFLPVNYHFGGWPAWLDVYAVFLWIPASFYWLVPVQDRLGRMCSLIFFHLFAYLLIAPPFSWYFPPVMIFSLVVFTRLLWISFQMLKDEIIIKSFMTLFIAFPMIAASLYFVSMTFIQMKIQQETIEMGNRKKIGLWLKENVRPGENVYLEPLGYIGYFSQAKMLDYPGLVSPEVLRLRKETGLGFYTLITKLNPDWVIFRYQEVKKITPLDYFRAHYRPVKKFIALERLKEYNFIPGRDYVLYDSAFYIFKKNDL